VLILFIGDDPALAVGDGDKAAILGAYFAGYITLLVPAGFIAQVVCPSCRFRTVSVSNCASSELSVSHSVGFALFRVCRPMHQSVRT
jgi:hypothetical protein